MSTTTQPPADRTTTPILLDESKRRRHIQDLDESRRKAVESTRGRLEIFGHEVATSSSKQYVTCSKCGKEVGATRFAPHLQKCQQQPNSSTSGGGRARSLSLTTTRTPSPESQRVAAWDAPCHNCRSIDAPELMMLCDACSRLFHIHCVTPRIETIPPSPWFCNRCQSKIVEFINTDTATTTTTPTSLALSALDKVALGAVAHENSVFGCDSCDIEMTPGTFRWRCLKCFEIDVCEMCFGKTFGTHKSSHAMVKLTVTA